MSYKNIYLAPEAEELILVQEGPLCNSIDADLVDPGREDDWGTI